MEDHQIAKHNMTSKLSLFLNNPLKVAIYSGNTNYVLAVGNFNSTKTKWDNLIPLEQVLTGGVTDAKNIAKRSMASYWASMAQTVRGNALLQTTVDTAVAEDMNRTEAKIFKQPDSVAKGTCDYLATTISALITAGSPLAVGVSAPDVTAGTVMTTAFDALVGKPHDLEDARTAVVEQIKLAIEEMDLRLKTLDALTAGIFFNNQLAYRLEFKEKREIEDLPDSHTELEVLFKHKITGTPLSGITLKDTRPTGKTAVSDNIGVALLKTFRGGDNILFTGSGTGFKVANIIKTVKTGKKISVTVEMEPQ